MTIKTERSTKLRDEKWLRKMADLEDQHSSVSVGGMACDLGLLTMSKGRPTGVFGRFVEFARRKQKLSVEELANRAEIDLGDLVAIEQVPDARPQIMTVHRLATYLKLPPKPLMELAGLMEAKSGSIGTAALRFAAQSETTAELSPQENLAFDEFVKAIVKASDR